MPDQYIPIPWRWARDSEIGWDYDSAKDIPWPIEKCTAACDHVLRGDTCSRCGRKLASHPTPDRTFPMPHQMLERSGLRFSVVGEMIHLSGYHYPLGRINDSTTPIIEAQEVVYDIVQRLRPDTKVAFLGLKHDVHNQVETISANDIIDGHCSVPADALIVPKHENVALAVFVGDCIAMRMEGSSHLALLHCGWQEARDNIGRHFRNTWLDLGEHMMHTPTCGMCISAQDLELGGQALLDLHAAGMDNYLYDLRGSHLPIRWALGNGSHYESGELSGNWWEHVKLGLDLPGALNIQMYPDAQPVEGHLVEQYLQTTSGSTMRSHYHASDRAAKARGKKSVRDCYVVMPAA